MLWIEQTPLGPRLAGPETNSDRMAWVGMKRSGKFYISTQGSMWSREEALQMAVEIRQCADAIIKLNGAE